MSMYLKCFDKYVPVKKSTLTSNIMKSGWKEHVNFVCK